jgi:uncharacterized protein YjeT (DUF2065 family)
MWHNLLVALALMLVMEGILPFLNPAAMRRMLLVLSQSDEHTLRIGGLVTMLLGLALLYLVN